MPNRELGKPLLLPQSWQGSWGSWILLGREKGDLLAGAVLAGHAKPHLQELPGGLLLLLFQLGDQVAEVGDVARELSDGTIDTVVDGQV